MAWEASHRDESYKADESIIILSNCGESPRPKLNNIVIDSKRLIIGSPKRANIFKKNTTMFNKMMKNNEEKVQKQS